jgi:hypothetical protein
VDTRPQPSRRWTHRWPRLPRPKRRPTRPLPPRLAGFTHRRTRIALRLIRRLRENVDHQPNRRPKNLRVLLEYPRTTRRRLHRYPLPSAVPKGYATRSLTRPRKNMDDSRLRRGFSMGFQLVSARRRRHRDLSRKRCHSPSRDHLDGRIWKSRPLLRLVRHPRRHVERASQNRSPTCMAPRPRVRWKKSRCGRLGLHGGLAARGFLLSLV